MTWACVGAVLVCCLLVTSTASAEPDRGNPATVSTKWYTGGVFWPRATNSFYCTTSAVNAHSSWPATIANAVDLYSNYANGGTQHPQWSAGCPHANHPIDVLNIPLGTLSSGGPCGNSDHTPATTGYLTHAYVRFNSQVAYDHPGIYYCHFYHTAIHEFGHSQGLPHSCNSAAIMYKYDNPVDYLTTDDKSAYQWLYNRPPFTGTPDAGCP
ncbi:matrixin family metalloprotease [Nakamurella lactea]|uniref:matrixin family metalloprotease n=1 Tax=Nakamurella lactea TaxID=459515 RepID=UPI0009FEB206